MCSGKFRQAFQSGQERLQYQAGDCLSEIEQATPTLPLADTAFFLCLCSHLALSSSPGRFNVIRADGLAGRLSRGSAGI